MIESFSTHYFESKRIKLGEATIFPYFLPLADWINKKYGITVLNVAYSITPAYQPTPTLNVYIESEKEATNIRGYMSHLLREDIKTAIEEQFWLHLQKPKPDSDDPYKNLLVFLNVFENEAFFETCRKVTDHMLETLRIKLSPQAIWKIECVGDLITFFVHTNSQLDKLKNSPELDLWKKHYLEMLTPLDEFKYLNEDNINIRLDSQENLQNKFGGSMQSYYRDK